VALKADLVWDDAASQVQQASSLIETAVQNLQIVAAGKGSHALAAQQEADRLHAVALQLRAKAPQPAAPPPTPPAK